MEKCVKDKVRLGVDIDPEDHQKLRIYAARTGRKMNAAIVYMIRYFYKLEKLDKEG